MFNTIKVRQGALVCHVAPDGKVTYEICLPVPYGFPVPVNLINNINVHKNGKRTYIMKEFGADLEAATVFKLSLQDAVTSHKIELLQSRKLDISDRLNEVLNNKQ